MTTKPTLAGRLGLEGADATGAGGLGGAGPTRLELRVVLDTACPPTVEVTGSEVVLLVADGHGLWVELVLPVPAAARWVGQLASAVTAALHDAFGSAGPSGASPAAEPGHSQPW